MRTIKYILVAIFVITLGTSAAKARSQEPLQKMVADTVTTQDPDEINVIAKKLTDWLNTQLVLTDRQYRRINQLMFKEAVILKAKASDAVLQEAKNERHKKMQNILKEYQYNLYLKIKDAVYTALEEKEKQEEN